jgi:hypothetical protein
MTCCDLQGNSKEILSTSQPPAGFSYYNSTTKQSQNLTRDHRASDWQRASSVFNKKRDSLVVGRMLQSLTPDRGSIDRSSSDLAHAKSDIRRKSSGSWKQEIPTPLPDWTHEDQQVLIDILKEFPRAGRDHTQLELALVKAMKKMPHRTSDDCHRAFQHIQESRIAIFRR